MAARRAVRLPVLSRRNDLGNRAGKASFSR
jgi:hypothetical protein